MFNKKKREVIKLIKQYLTYSFRMYKDIIDLWTKIWRDKMFLVGSKNWTKDNNEKQGLGVHWYVRKGKFCKRKKEERCYFIPLDFGGEY